MQQCIVSSTEMMHMFPQTCFQILRCHQQSLNQHLTDLTEKRRGEVVKVMFSDIFFCSPNLRKIIFCWDNYHQLSKPIIPNLNHQDNHSITLSTTRMLLMSTLTKYVKDFFFTGSADHLRTGSSTCCSCS